VREFAVKKPTGALLALLCLFAGIIIGFLLSPAKRGIQIGNNSGNTIYLPKKD
jgi:hypothetical protein